jgi:hypothetical protein
MHHHHHYHLVDPDGKTITVWFTLGMMATEEMYGKPGYTIQSCTKPLYICNYRTLTPERIAYIDRKFGIGARR